MFKFEDSVDELWVTEELSKWLKVVIEEVAVGVKSALVDCFK